MVPGKETDLVHSSAEKPVSEARVVRVDTSGKRRYTNQQKKEVCEEAEAAVAQGITGGVKAILEREGIGSSLLHTWRKKYREGRLDGPGMQASRIPRRNVGRRDPVKAAAVRSSDFGKLEATNKKLRTEKQALQARVEKIEKWIELQRMITDMVETALRS